MAKGMESISAMWEFMDTLGLERSKQMEFKVQAKIFNSIDKTSGVIKFKINSNWHSTSGPYLDFDETIKGFGIMFTKFDPNWVDMSWDKESLTLMVEDRSKPYAFSLTFSPPKSR